MPKLPELKCSLCGGDVPGSQPFFRATGSFLPSQDPLSRYCNGAMHWDCYANWADRGRFAREYVNAWVEANRKNPFWWSVYRDEAVYVSVNPARGIEQASVRLYATGSDVRIPLPRWAEWLANPERVTPGLHLYEQQALQRVLPSLLARFPDDHAVVDAIDPKEKARRSAGK